MSSVEMELLNGEFLMPAPGGDLIRNPDVLTGRNMHALTLFDPSPLLPLKSPDVVRKLLEKLKEQGGAYPESIAFTSGN
jgi:magnesium chelatase subunit H